MLGKRWFTAGMDITKAEAKAGLGVDTDAALARFLNISRQALNRYAENDALASSLQWQLRARRPDVFGTASVDQHQLAS